VAEQVATHISRDPDIYGGKPCIDGHRIAVHDIAAQLKQGCTPDQIAATYTLSRGQVYAALAYYFDHQEERERELSEDEAEIRRLARADTSPATERIRRAIAERRHQQGG
jgi:uncharacterized protein (DUF433 family)